MKQDNTQIVILRSFLITLQLLMKRSFEAVKLLTIIVPVVILPLNYIYEERHHHLRD